VTPASAGVSLEYVSSAPGLPALTHGRVLSDLVRVGPRPPRPEGLPIIQQDLLNALSSTAKLVRQSKLHKDSTTPDVFASTLVFLPAVPDLVSTLTEADSHPAGAFGSGLGFISASRLLCAAIHVTQSRSEGINDTEHVVPTSSRFHPHRVCFSTSARCSVTLLVFPPEPQNREIRSVILRNLFERHTGIVIIASKTGSPITTL
jgi:hypothetical protein